MSNPIKSVTLKYEDKDGHENAIINDKAGIKHYISGVEISVINKDFLNLLDNWKNNDHQTNNP